MEHRKLGRSGLQVSAIGLGTNNFGRRLDARETAAVVHQALEEGITFIDTANGYGGGLSEEYIGTALSGRRQEAILATKVGWALGKGPHQGGASRKHIMEQIDISLSRLRTDYVDLYQIHFPDANTPIEETLRVLDDLVRQGKVRYVGCSNFSSWQICEAFWTSRTMALESFVSAQPEWSLLDRQVEIDLVPFCKEYQLGVIPYHPLAGGFLTGKYRPGSAVPKGTRFFGDETRQQRVLTARNFEILSRLESFAKEHGRSIGDLAIAWLLASSQVSTVISGATSPRQVMDNAKAADWVLTPKDMIDIDALLEIDL